MWRVGSVKPSSCRIAPAPVQRVKYMEILLLLADAVGFTLLCLWMVRIESTKRGVTPMTLFAFRTGPGERPRQGGRRQAARRG
jgi:hypothetical protein